METANGAWRVRYRLNGKRRSTCAFSSRDLAQDCATGLHDLFPDLPTSGGAK
ncbi:hypothetical protein [Streptacidiphilus sp. PAMC 29251]